MVFLLLVLVHYVSCLRAHPEQIALSKMVTNELIVDLALSMSIVEKTEFLHAIFTGGTKFVVSSRCSVCREEESCKFTSSYKKDH